VTESQNSISETLFKMDRPTKPVHYAYEIQPWDVIKDWDLDFWEGNAVKYICRAGGKDGNSRAQDIRKAIENLKEVYQQCLEDEVNG